MKIRKAWQYFLQVFFLIANGVAAYLIWFVYRLNPLMPSYFYGIFAANIIFIIFSILNLIALYKGR